MATITMQGIADLAGVKRPVVPMWRKRFADSGNPFPAPLDNAKLKFDATEVGQWLRSTGHGNNPDAHLETLLHSSSIADAQQDLNTTSALLLLSELCGESIQTLPTQVAVDTAVAVGAQPVLTTPQIEQALQDPALAQAIDELVEAAYSGTGALDGFYSKERLRNPELNRETFTAQAEAFLAEILSEVMRSGSRVLAPHGTAALLLVNALADLLTEDDHIYVVTEELASPTPSQLLAWRRLVAKGVTLINFEDALRGSEPTTHLYVAFDPASGTFFNDIEDLVEDLDLDDQLIVIGPTRLLLDSAGAPGRRNLLTPHPDYTERLRYITELPRGLSRTQTRLRLGLWAFGSPQSRLTVTSSHACAPVTSVEANSLASDLAAALDGDGSITVHAFPNSAVRASRYLLRRESLSLTPDLLPPVDGGERLALIWQLDDGIMGDTPLIATESDRVTVPFSEAAQTRGRDLSGSLIPDDDLTNPNPGHVPVLGVEEIAGNSLPGTRTIDRLLLEKVAPRSRFTNPGDVSYAAGTGAMVDEVGGNAVQTPARIFRCNEDPYLGRVLTPEVVCQDIAAQAHMERGTWQLRPVTPQAAELISPLAARIAARRAELETELVNLATLQEQLLNGLADGTLNVEEESLDSSAAGSE